MVADGQMVFTEALVHCLYYTIPFRNRLRFTSTTTPVLTSLKKLFEAFSKNEYSNTAKIFKEFETNLSKDQDYRAHPQSGVSADRNKLLTLFTILHRDTRSFTVAEIFRIVDEIFADDLNASYGTLKEVYTYDSAISEIFGSIVKEHKIICNAHDRCVNSYVPFSSFPNSGCCTYVTTFLVNHFNGTNCQKCDPNRLSARRFSRFPNVLLIDRNLAFRMEFQEELDLSILRYSGYKLAQIPIYYLYAVVYSNWNLKYDVRCRDENTEQWYRLKHGSFQHSKLEKDRALLLFYRIKENRGNKGLENCSGTCFVNAAIQCLSHTKEFSKYFREENYTPSPPKATKVSDALCELLSKMWKDKTAGPFKVNNLMTAMSPTDDSEFYSSGKGGFSADVCDKLLNLLHEELIDNTKTPFPAMQDPVTTRHSIILDIFGMVFSEVPFEYEVEHKVQHKHRFQYKLRHCVHAKDKTGPPAVPYDHFELHTWVQNVGVNNFHDCKYAEYIEIFPKILIIDCNRMKHVEFNVVLNLTEFVTDQTKSKEKPIYDLYAVIYRCCTGLNTETRGVGHSFAVCKNENDNEWWYYSDETVRILPGFVPKKMYKSTPEYFLDTGMLFYRMRK